MTRFEYQGQVAEEDDVEFFAEPAPASSGYPPMNCPCCGRFAKYLSTNHYYNGTWDCIRINVLCSRCGEQGIECV